MKYLLFAILLLGITACIPDEDPIAPYNRGSAKTGTAGMGSLYGTQIYYNLEKNQIIKQNGMLEWDLGFACADDKFEIILNFAKFMSVIDLGAVNFDTVKFKDYPDSLWVYDNSDGKLDSTAIGDWRFNNSNISKNHVYIINRGLDEKAKTLGFIKFQIIGFENNSYKIKFTDLKKNITNQIDVPKKSQYNYIQLLFDGAGSVVELEPNKDDWDILFSKYTQLLYTDVGDKMWYSVTSGLVNPSGVSAALIPKGDFNTVSATILDSLKLSSNRNAIGHEWKTYSMETGSYVVNSNMIYIIKGIQGFYYKMHFIEFYDNNGNKGYPKFEYQKL